MCDGFGIMLKDDSYFMKLALNEANKAFLKDEVPVGAVIVKDGMVLSKGHNLKESKNDPTAHAEIIAIKKACKKIKSWRLNGCKIYVTIEPCPMCAGAIIASRVEEVIYGVSDEKGGSFGTILNLSNVSGLNHKVNVKSNVLANECSMIIKNYFKNKREVKKCKKLTQVS